MLMIDVDVGAVEVVGEDVEELLMSYVILSVESSDELLVDEELDDVV